MQLRRSFRLMLTSSLAMTLLLLAAAATLAFPADTSFGAVWASTDAGVADGSASYSWLWGPELRDQRAEAYQESPGAAREVRYYDKSRMEINNPGGDQSSSFYVTNGLLTEELVTGNMQVGPAGFEQRQPSAQLVAGDQIVNPGTPSYATFAPYATTDGITHRATEQQDAPVNQLLAANGDLSTTDSGAVTLTNYQATTGHNFASGLWEWANDTASGFRPEQGVDWLYVLGYPISEPYWIDSTVGGTQRRVLVQLFERRVLSDTADNPAAYRVEFGNIGLHYHDWRYGPSPISERATAISGAPATDGVHVVWSATNDDIYSLDLASGAVTPLIHSALYESAPDVDGSRVVWAQHDPGCYACGDVMYADIANGEPFTIAATSADEESPSVSGDWVTWIAFDPTGVAPAQLLAWNVTTRSTPRVLFEAHDSVYAPAIAAPQIDVELAQFSSP